MTGANSTECPVITVPVARAIMYFSPYTTTFVHRHQLRATSQQQQQHFADLHQPITSRVTGAKIMASQWR